VVTRRPGPRVCLVTLNYAPEVSGIGPYTASLAHGLAQRGFRVRIVAAAPHYPMWRVADRGTWSPEERDHGVEVRRITSYVPRRPRMLNRALFEILYGLRFASRSYDDDVVVLVSPGMLASAVMRLRLPRRIPVVLWVQDVYSAGVTEVGGRGGVAARLIAQVEGWLMRRCDRVVVIHERFTEQLAALFSLQSDTIRVIRNWAQVDNATRAEPVDLRARFGWPADATLVVHAGTMGVKQDLGNVVATARLAESTGAPIRFILIGQGSQRADLEELARGCHTIGFIDPLPEARLVPTLRTADLLLVNEAPGVVQTALPSKLTTYFSSGRPVIAATESDSVTATEVTASGAGVVVAPGDPEALIMAVQQLAAADTAHLQRAGASYVSSMLEPDASLDDWAETLASLTEEQVTMAVHTGKGSER